MVTWNLSHDELRRQQRALLDAQATRLHRESPFYESLWGCPRPSLESLPLVTKKDLHNALAAGFLGTNVAVSHDKIVHIHASSGTSGRPTYFGLTEADYQGWLDVFARGFELAGVQAGQRVLHAFAMSRGYAGGVPMADALYRMGCLALPMGAEAGSARLVDAIDRLKPAVLYASPSMCRHLAQRHLDLTGRSAADSSVCLVLTGGEPGAGDPASKQALGLAWGAEVRELGGGTDVCPMMFVECAQKAGLHFIAGDQVSMELIDPDTGDPRPVAPGVRGEVVYSHLAREANPVMRMRHGDVIEVDPTDCPCGLSTLRMRFIGRSDDMIIVRGVKIFPSSLQEIVSEFQPTLTGGFQIRHHTSSRADEALTVICETSTVDDVELLRAFESRAREVLGVRVSCSLVPVGSLGADAEQKGQLIQRV